MDRTVILAQGKMAALIAGVLHGAGVMTRGEFRRTLSTFAATVAETEPEQGELLCLWAAMVGDDDTQPMDTVNI